MPAAWFWRKVRQLCDGRRRDLGRYFRIVAVEACRPSLASSSRIRGLPQVGLTLHIRRMSWINSRSFAGRPSRRLPDQLVIHLPINVVLVGLEFPALRPAKDVEDTGCSGDDRFWQGLLDDGGI